MRVLLVRKGKKDILIVLQIWVDCCLRSTAEASDIYEAGQICLQSHKCLTAIHVRHWVVKFDDICVFHFVICVSPNGCALVPGNNMTGLHKVLNRGQFSGCLLRKYTLLITNFKLF